MAIPDWLTAKPVAHRGLHDAARGFPENSLASVRAAMERGLPVEVDLQMAADGLPVVFHDHTLDRMTEVTGPVHDRTATRLAEFRLAGTPETIPTLDDLLGAVHGTVPLFLEIKSDGLGDNAARLVGATAARLNSYDGPVAIMSFDPYAVRAAAAFAPDHPTGLLSGGYRGTEGDVRLNGVQRWWLRNLLPAVFRRPDFIAYDIAALPATAPKMAGRFGLPLLTWTVRTTEERTRARQHADQMIFENFLPSESSNPNAVR